MMRVTAKKSASVGRFSRPNGQLCERRSRTSTAKPDKVLNQGMDHFRPRPVFLHVGYLTAVSSRYHLHAVAARAKI